MYVIVVGAGKVGWNLARELLEKNHEVTVIESNRRRYLTVEQELEHIKAKTYDVMRRELRHREYVPVSNEAGPGAETISYYQYDQVGTAKLISNYADDLPLANVKGKKFSAPVHSMGIGFAYSVQDIRASQMANKRLEQRDATAAGFRRLELMATLAGRPLYSAFGFEPIEELVDTSTGTEIPLVRMGMSITAPEHAGSARAGS